MEKNNWLPPKTCGGRLCPFARLKAGKSVTIFDIVLAAAAVASMKRFTPTTANGQFCAASADAHARALWPQISAVSRRTLTRRRPYQRKRILQAVAVVARRRRRCRRRRCSSLSPFRIGSSPPPPPPPSSSSSSSIKRRRHVLRARKRVCMQARKLPKA